MLLLSVYFYGEAEALLMITNNICFYGEADVLLMSTKKKTYVFMEKLRCFC